MTVGRSLSFFLVIFTLMTPAAAQQSPFAPPPKPEPHFIRLLAFADYFDADALAEFEKQTGKPIAYDAYDAADQIPAKMREGNYDLVVLPGPVLHEQIGAGTLQKIDRTRLKNVSAVAPRVLAKLAAYDATGAYGLPYMWFATGLLLAAIPLVLIARFVVVIPWGLYHRFRGERGATTILGWGGLHGALSLALALSLPEGPERTLLLAVTYAVVAFSISVQGLSFGPVVKRITA